MFKAFLKFFKNQQLSFFFQIAIILNFVGLLLDIIVYRYFSDSEILKSLCLNIGNLSLFIICVIVISESLSIFIKSHKKLVTQYKFAAITIELLMSVFFMWILTTDNDIQEGVIIFLSEVSRLNNNNRVILLLIIICITLILSLYNSFKIQDKINKNSIQNMMKSTFKLIIQEYMIIFIILFGMIHFTKIHKFSQALIEDTKSSLLFNLTLLEIIIPTAWSIMLIYHVYHHYYLKDQ